MWKLKNITLLSLFVKTICVIIMLHLIDDNYIRQGWWFLVNFIIIYGVWSNAVFPIQIRNVYAGQIQDGSAKLCTAYRKLIVILYQRISPKSCYLFFWAFIFGSVLFQISFQEHIQKRSRKQKISFNLGQNTWFLYS